LLIVKDVRASYGETQVLRGFSLEVNKKEMGVIIGPNGHGKSTALKAVAGLLRVQSGSIYFEGDDITELPVHERVDRGIVLVSEEGNLFVYMTVLENLKLGAYREEAWKETLTEVFRIFPRLEERKNQIVWTLSGGERKMCAIGRGLMAKPKLLMLDEPSLGLAPKITESLFETIHEISRTGITLLFAEQNVYRASDIANKFYLVNNGKIELEGSVDEVLNSPLVKRTYFGTS